LIELVPYLLVKKYMEENSVENYHEEDKAHQEYPTYKDSGKN
jgi:hypothetical protein